AQLDVKCCVIRVLLAQFADALAQSFQVEIASGHGFPSRVNLSAVLASTAVTALPSTEILSSRKLPISVSVLRLPLGTVNVPSSASVKPSVSSADVLSRGLVILSLPHSDSLASPGPLFDSGGSGRFKRLHRRERTTTGYSKFLSRENP